ncbi:MAG: hypothetical protein K9J72_10415 [Synechococcus sp. Tobar2m-G35]|nr:hypothetical protein [Synechococcus sp. Tobar2m-G35]
MKALVKATLAVSIGASALMVAPEAKALSYTVGGTVTSSAAPSSQRQYTLDTNTMSIGGVPASGDANTAFGNFLYQILGGPVNAGCSAAKNCPLSWATPLTVALTNTTTFGNSITFDNPLVTRTNPLGAANTFAGFGTFTTSSGKTGSLSFTVNPANTWGGTLDLNVSVPGPLPAAGVIAGLGLARRMRRQLKATV